MHLFDGFCAVLGSEDFKTQLREMNFEQPALRRIIVCDQDQFPLCRVGRGGLCLQIVLDRVYECARVDGFCNMADATGVDSTLLVRFHRVRGQSHHRDVLVPRVCFEPARQLQSVYSG